MITITQDEFESMVPEWVSECAEIRRAKAADYASADDAFDNFRQAAGQLGLTSEQVWGVYASKHWSAIQAYCKDPEGETSEPIAERIYDLINYLLLLRGEVYARAVEDGVAPAPEIPVPVSPVDEGAAISGMRPAVRA